MSVVCTDLNKSLKFYCDMLGGHTIRDRKEALENKVESKAASVVLGLGVETSEFIVCEVRFSYGEGAPVLALLQWIKPASTGKPYDKLNNVGIARMALAVDDIYKIYNDLKAKGVEFLSPPQELDQNIPEQPPVRIVACKDPDGIIVEFVEGDSGSWRDDMVKARG
jgi:catechol 2,3-dioxygenase-like lactoylglutathione lyase family enzyme